MALRSPSERRRPLGRTNSAKLLTPLLVSFRSKLWSSLRRRLLIIHCDSLSFDRELDLAFRLISPRRVGEPTFTIPLTIVNGLLRGDTVPSAPSRSERDA